MSKLCGIEILLGGVCTVSSKGRGVHTIERQKARIIETTKSGTQPNWKHLADTQF